MMMQIAVSTKRVDKHIKKLKVTTILDYHSEFNFRMLVIYIIQKFK